MKRLYVLAAALALCCALLPAPGLADGDEPVESPSATADASGEAPDDATTEPELDVTPEPVVTPDPTPVSDVDPGVTPEPENEVVDADAGEDYEIEDVEGDVLDIGGGVTPAPTPVPTEEPEPEDEPSDEPEEVDLSALEAALERLTGNRRLMYAASDRLQAALTPPAPEPQLINLYGGGADEPSVPARRGPLGAVLGAGAVCALGAGASVWDYRRKRGLWRTGRSRRRRREFKP